jgi:hypothetical protein
VSSTVESWAHGVAAPDPRYWFWRCRALEIQWVVNVLSNILVANGALPIGDMTVRGRMKAAEMLGVAEARP